MMDWVFFCIPILALLIWTGISMWRHTEPERVCTELLAVCAGIVFLLTLFLSPGSILERLVTAVGTVFTLIQGDSDEFVALLPAVSEAVGLLQALSILTPLLTAGTAFVLLFRQLPLPVLLPRKCHIFSALDGHAILLAKSIAKTEKARFIFLRTKRADLSADTLLELRGLRYCCYPYGETQLMRRHLTLRIRPLCFYFLTENSEDNFDQMEEFLGQAGLFFTDTANPPLRELFLLSETSSAPMLIDHLRKTYHKLPNTELRLLDRYRAASLHLMKTAPLYEARRNGNVRVLLLGMGQVGRSLYRTMVSMGVIGNHQPEFHLLDKNVTEILDSMKQQYPELGEGLKVIPKECDAEGSELNKLLCAEKFDYIVVALGDDERNLRVTAALYRHYRKQFWSGALASLPQICLNLENETKARSAERIYLHTDPKDWEPRVTIFGTDQEVFSAEVLLPRGLWLAARKLHALLNGAADPKADWGEYERRSSIAAVAHGAAHVASLFDGEDLLSADYPALMANKLTLLRRAEHRRWMNYVRSEGMTRATDLIWKRYAKHLHTHVDVQGQLTPCLIDSDQLFRLFNELKAALPESFTDDTLNFQKRDELVVRNADIFYRYWLETDTDLELRPLPPSDT